MRRPTTPFTRVVTLAILIVSATACGVPLDTTARVLPPIEVLVAPTSVPPTTIAPTRPAPDSRGVVVFLIRNEGLVGRARVTQEGYTPTELLQFLFDGPLASDNPMSLRSGLQQRTDLVSSAGVFDRVARFEISAEFTDLPGIEQVLILGQITLTMTSNLDIDGVEFYQNDAPIAVPDANLEPVSIPVRRANYSALLAR
jgi:hypothetical protein